MGLNMKAQKIIIVFFSLLFLLSSCEKDGEIGFGAINTIVIELRY